MRTIRQILILLLILGLATSPAAADRRRSVAPPPDAAVADALALGRVSGATISGTVASVTGTVLTMNTGSASPIRIDVAGAKIVGAREPDLTLADVTAGARVTAFIDQAPGASTTLRAQVLMVELSPDLMITGPIESIDVAGSKLAVLGIVVAVDAKTSFGSVFPTFAPIKGLADLAVGQIVAMDVAISGPQLLARRVMVAAQPIDTHSVRGTVKSISETAWVITEKNGKDTTVAVDASTRIAGNPVVGNDVQVVVRRDSSGALVALLIVRLEAGKNVEVQLTGWVTAIDKNHWRIRGAEGAPEVKVDITKGTVIYPDPKVGDHVTVVGWRKGSSDNFTAIAIRKL